MSRRQARRAALNVLYQSDVSGVAPATVLTEVEELEGPSDPFTRELVEGVAGNLEELDKVVGEHAEGWTVPRMAGLERCILRLACYEIRFVDEVPVGVAIDEAVEAASELATPEAARFVNGVLGAIARS